MTETTMSFIDRITIEINKELDDAIFSEIKMMAVENGLEAKVVLDEKNIITALKKQIPKKLICIETEKCCPVCKEGICFIGDDGNYGNYCYKCGQALDWSDSE